MFRLAGSGVWDSTLPPWVTPLVTAVAGTEAARYRLRRMPTENSYQLLKRMISERRDFGETMKALGVNWWVLPTVSPGKRRPVAITSWMGAR